MKETPNIPLKIKAVEKDIMDLKLSIIKVFVPPYKKNVSLKGIIKGIKISDKNILAVKKSLFSTIKA
jgi:hypothetical protein